MPVQRKYKNAEISAGAAGRQKGWKIHFMVVRFLSKKKVAGEEDTGEKKKCS